MLRKRAVGRHKLYLMSVCAWCTRSFAIRAAACGQKLCLLGSHFIGRISKRKRTFVQGGLVIMGFVELFIPCLFGCNLS